MYLSFALLFCGLAHLAVSGAAEELLLAENKKALRGRVGEQETLHQSFGDLAQSVDVLETLEGKNNDCPACMSLPPCDPGPVACPLNYLPVCGCDGKTYGNECEAKSLNCLPCVTQGPCPMLLDVPIPPKLKLKPPPKPLPPGPEPPLSFPFSLGTNAEIGSIPIPPLSILQTHDVGSFPGPKPKPPPPPKPEPHPPHKPPKCHCPDGHLLDCCHIPAPLCEPDRSKCDGIPPFLPQPEVCGCDGKTYANPCLALFEGCLQCWSYGACE